jgi:hypothetical protein
MVFAECGSSNEAALVLISTDLFIVVLVGDIASLTSQLGISRDSVTLLF